MPTNSQNCRTEKLVANHILCTWQPESSRLHSGTNSSKDGQNTNVFILTCMNRKYSSNNSYYFVTIYWVIISQLYFICHKQSRVLYIKSYSISLILQYLPIFSNFVHFPQLKNHLHSGQEYFQIPKPFSESICYME